VASNKDSVEWRVTRRGRASGKQVRMGGSRPLSLVSRRCSLGWAPSRSFGMGKWKSTSLSIPIAHNWALSATRSTKNRRCSIGLDCSPQASLGVRQRSCRFDPASLVVASLLKRSCRLDAQQAGLSEGGSELPHSKALRAAVPAVAAPPGVTFSERCLGQRWVLPQTRDATYGWRSCPIVPAPWGADHGPLSCPARAASLLGGSISVGFTPRLRGYSGCCPLGNPDLGAV